MGIEEKKGSIPAKDTEGDGMPTIEAVECQRVAYVKGMKDYLKKLKSMTNGEAVKRSRKSLESSNIIQEDGEFTDRYRYSRLHTEYKD